MQAQENSMILTHRRMDEAEPERQRRALRVPCSSRVITITREASFTPPTISG